MDASAVLASTYNEHKLRVISQYENIRKHIVAVLSQFMQAYQDEISKPTIKNPNVRKFWLQCLLDGVICRFRLVSLLDQRVKKRIQQLDIHHNVIATRISMYYQQKSSLWESLSARIETRKNKPKLAGVNLDINCSIGGSTFTKHTKQNNITKNRCTDSTGGNYYSSYNNINGRNQSSLKQRSLQLQTRMPKTGGVDYECYIPVSIPIRIPSNSNCSIILINNIHSNNPNISAVMQPGPAHISDNTNLDNSTTNHSNVNQISVSSGNIAESPFVPVLGVEPAHNEQSRQSSVPKGLPTTLSHVDNITYQNQKHVKSLNQHKHVRTTFDCDRHQPSQQFSSITTTNIHSNTIASTRYQQSQNHTKQLSTSTTTSTPKSTPKSKTKSSKLKSKSNMISYIYRVRVKKQCVQEKGYEKVFDGTWQYKYECKYCRKRYKVAKNCHNHYLTHFGIGYVCMICQKVFPRKQNAVEHLRKQLSYFSFFFCNVQAYFCTIFSVLAVYATQKRSLNQCKHYHLYHCFSFFGRDSWFYAHTTQYSTGERPYQCRFPFCYSRFKQSHSRKYHEKKMHKFDFQKQNHHSKRV